MRAAFARNSFSSRRQFPRFILGLLIFNLVLSVNGRLAFAHGPSPSGHNPTADSLTNMLLALSAQHRQASPADQGRIESQLLATATARYQLLASLIEDDPAEVLRVAVPAALRAALPPAVQGYVEQEADVEGVLQVLHEDGHTGSRYLYFLNTAAERLSLHFAADPPELLTGSRVRARGIRVNNTLALGSGKGGSVQTLSSVVPNTFGAQPTLVILVNFQDAPTEPFTPESVRTAFFTTTSTFWLENSYEQTWLTGDVAGWFTIAYDSTGCDSFSIGNLAEAAATAAGLTLSAYTHHLYVFPSNSHCGWGGLSTVGGNPSQEWLNGTIDLPFTAHELGHGLGLWHSHALDCGTATIGTVMSSTFPPPPGTCYVIEYGDLIDAMGSAYPGHYNAFQKERLGWLNYGSSPPITTATTNGTYFIEAYASASPGPKALKILKSTDSTTGAKTWYYVEARKPIGFDAVLDTTASTVGIVTTIPDGVLVHLGTESSGNSGSLLDMSPATDTSIWDWLVDAPLLVGQTFSDPAAGVTMTTESVTSTGATVTVSFEAALTVTTDRSNYTRNQSVSITATVRSGGSPVTNAAVSFSVTKANGVLVTASGTTGSNGTAVYKLRLGRQDPPGLYRAGAVATGSGMSASGTTSFMVQ
jgi:Gametolysin peptidase M11